VTNNFAGCPYLHRCIPLPRATLSHVKWVPTVAINGIRRDGTVVAIMAAILPFTRGSDGVFDPKDITAMSMALDDELKPAGWSGKRNHRRAHS
jgi:hypothetical protein